MTREAFAALHHRGDPLILYNVWDAGSAVAVADAGAAAIATGSHSLAGAQGYADGEAIPFEQMLVTIHQIAGAVTVPLSVDFESGYGENAGIVGQNASALVEAGVVGCNLEDQLIDGDGLRAIAEQCERIAAADEAGLFVNARTDVFLSVMRAGEDPNRADLVEQAVERAAAYEQAGAGSFFVPGLSDPDLIARVCEQVDLPVNVMRLDGLPTTSDLGALGVARISYGGAPWRAAMEQVQGAAQEAITT